MKTGTAEYDAIKTAMLTHSPACLHDDRFTSDVLTASQRDELQAKCDSCLLLDWCRAYADTVPAKTAFAGFWAGRYWGQVIA